MAIYKIDIVSETYPENLKHIFDPPQRLFMKGGIEPSDQNAVAIVGTRRPTLYGTQTCEKLSYELAGRGITIISGMARGIDSAAHRGAIRAGGRTIAVLGSGHNHVYPPENRRLYEEISAHGAVISEYPLDAPPLKTHFPRRNRIISGLSRGVLVVEAAERSGALITARFALEQGRDVFAVPGNVGSATSTGTNRLIKEGAKLVETAGDILDELKYIISFKDESGTGSGDRAIQLTSEERAIFDILDETPCAIDEISRIADLPVYRVSETLLRLELKKLVRTLPGAHFMRVA